MTAFYPKRSVARRTPFVSAEVSSILSIGESIPVAAVLLVCRENVAMNALHPQFVVDENQTPTAVLLPIPEWQQVVEDLEELDEIRAFDLAKAGSQETIPFEQAVREIE